MIGRCNAVVVSAVVPPIFLRNWVGYGETWNNQCIHTVMLPFPVTSLGLLYWLEFTTCEPLVQNISADNFTRLCRFQESEGSELGGEGSEEEQSEEEAEGEPEGAERMSFPHPSPSLPF